MQAVPRLSHVRREIAQGSPTALLKARLKHEKRAGSSRDHNERSITALDIDTETDTIPQITHVQRLHEMKAKLRDQRATGTDSVKYLTPIDVSKEDLSWGATAAAPLSPQLLINNAVRFIQRVGRGYLLRSFQPQTHSAEYDAVERSTSALRTAVLHRHKREDEFTKHRGASVSFVGSDNDFTPAPFQAPFNVRAKTLRGIYALSRLTANELEGMIDEAKKDRDRSTWKRLASPQASRLQRSASTLFLAPPEEPSALKKPTERENIRQTLMKVEKAMKQRLAELDKKTREAQRVQDLKMLDLAKDEATAHERQRQAKAHAREQARATRQQHREEEQAREAEAIAERKALQREYDIKRVEVHVELRQRYMLEDRVTALRNTLSELTNISHLSSTVPSLNLTQATKEAHFRAEGLVSRKSQEDP